MDGAAIGRAQHFIGNRWVPAAGGQTLDVLDPSDGAPFARIARGEALTLPAGEIPVDDAGRPMRICA